jgi:hypothetical protein
MDRLFSKVMDLSREKGGLLGAMELIATEKTMDLEWAREIARDCIASYSNKDSSHD